MTKEELAFQLTGHVYGEEISIALAAEAKAAGLVVVFGSSNDLIEFRGAWDEEAGAEGTMTDVLLTAQGIFNDHACAYHCRYFEEAQRQAERDGWICTAVWNAEGYSWIYRTNLPHATFDILDEGEPYCRGIVFALADLTRQAVS